MSASSHPIRLVAAALALAACLALSAVAAPEARADRCNPEELVDREPILFGPDQGPVCDVMLGIVYPSLDCDATTLRRCIATLDAVGTAYKNDQCVTYDFAGSQYCVLSDTTGR